MIRILLIVLSVLATAPGLANAQEETSAVSPAANDATTEVMASQSNSSDDNPALLQAQRHLGAGGALLEREDFGAAIVEFRRAYDLLEGHPQRHYALYNIGQCHERLFRYDEALLYYGRYLDEGGAEDEDAAGVRATVQTLEGLLGTIVLSVHFEEANDEVVSTEEVAIWVDDRHIFDADPGEHRFRVTGGRHLIEARGPGWVTNLSEISVPARGESPLRLTIAATSMTESYGGIAPPLFWSAAGLTLGSLVAGTTVGLMAMSERSRFANQATDTNDPARFLITTEDNERIERLALTADILLGGALLFGIATTAIYFVTDWDAEAESSGQDSRAQVRWTPVLSPHVLGLSVEGCL